MIRPYLCICMLAAGMFLCPDRLAEAADPAGENPETVCGLHLKARDVLVLDLQHMNRDPEQASEFVLDNAGNYRLAHPLLQEFRMSFRPSGNPEGVTRGARKLGVEKGCDLVLLLDTGPYLGKQRSWKSRPKDHGYAVVAMGQRLPDEP